MIGLSWNCRGLGHPRAVPVLCELVRTHRPDVIFLFETLTHTSKIEEIRIRLGFEGAFTVDREGRGGGICALWRSPNLCHVIGYSKNHIDMEIMDVKVGKWRLTGFYGYPERAKRREPCNLLRTLSALSQLPWCIIGDFNDLLSPDDKKGRVEHPNWLFRGFRDAVQDCNLADLPLMGYPFTWGRSKGSENAVEERLDRAMASPSWVEFFPSSRLSNLNAPISDHSPILLNTEGTLMQRSPKRFRFENRWLCDPGLRETVLESWKESSGLDIQSRLTHCSELLISWGRKFTNSFKKDIESTKRRINALRTKDDAVSAEQMSEMKTQLSNLLMQQEIYWQQRAKTFWLRDGDSNTKFFHASATARRKSNKIQKLKNDNGIWIEEAAELCSNAKLYFEDLFSASMGNYNPVLAGIEQRVTREDNESLIKPFHIDEFKITVFQMHPDKSPGPDGFNPAFYQKFWHIIGEDVFRACLHWIDRAEFPARLNDTNIVLIPKKDPPETMKDLGRSLSAM